MATPRIGDEPTTPPPDDHPRPPRVPLPPGSCDSHCHVFGPKDRFPYTDDRTFTPHDVPKERVFALQELLGFERCVIVQSMCHGLDHAVLFDALAAPGDRRGVALVRPGTTTTAQLDAFDAAGVCGARVHFLPHLGARPSLDQIQAVIDTVRPYPWHIEMHMSGDDLIELEPFLATIEAPLVLDHLARIDLDGGLDGPGPNAVRRLLDTGGVWLKLSGSDRVSKTGPPYTDAVALAHAFAEHAPERVVWGTDFPHPNVTHVPNDGDLVDLVAEIAPDPGIRHRMLVDNPVELFGFAPGLSALGEMLCRLAYALALVTGSNGAAVGRGRPGATR